jgi:hypothetical protein
MTRRLSLLVVAAAVVALSGAAADATTSSSYRFVGGSPITYTSSNQFVVIWRFNKAAPRGANGSLRTAANLNGVGYTGTPSNDPNAGYGATTLDKRHNCYQQTIAARGAIRNTKVGSTVTMTAYVWSHTVKAKIKVKKGSTTTASTAQSMAKSLGC